MEAAFALFSSIGSAAASAGSAVGSAAASLGSAVGLTAGAPLSLLPGAAGAATGAAGSGIGGTLASILSGTASALSIASGIGAANTEADNLNAAAIDAEREQALETLQGIGRRTSIKKELLAALGAQDTAYAASGVDLSFGSPGQARRDAFREADLALTTDAGTQFARQSRLGERASAYRRQARRTRGFGLLEAGTQLATLAAKEFA